MVQKIKFSIANTYGFDFVQINLDEFKIGLDLKKDKAILNQVLSVLKK